jgi:hypothetical protein
MANPSERQYWDEFRARLVKIRTDLDWSQADAAAALDIPLTNYKSYEVRSKFPLYLIEKLALVTHRDVEFIVTGRNVVKFRRQVA